MNSNKRGIVLLNGFRSGGTSIVWNILESHPQVCSPLHETGEIISKDIFKWLPEQSAKIIIINILRYHKILKLPVKYYFDPLIQRLLMKRKLDNFQDIDHRYKYDGVPYTMEEINDTVLCLKSVNWDNYLTDYIANYFENYTFFGLIRNGYAVCDGLIRRGYSAKRAGKIYHRFGQQMIKDRGKYDRYMILKFEDVLRDPFAMACEIFKFAGLEPPCLDKLRLKSKRVLSKTGMHISRFGKENRKYWFDKQTIQDFLKQNINEVQIKSLSKNDRLVFEKYAEPTLEYFGYS